MPDSEKEIIKCFFSFRKSRRGRRENNIMNHDAISSRGHQETGLRPLSRLQMIVFDFNLKTK